MTRGANQTGIQGLVALGVIAGCLASAAFQGGTEVEAPDLAKRSDLLGKEVAIDARIAFFQPHPGRGFDEVLLKESDVILRLPANMRFRQPPPQHSLKAEGVLVREMDKVFLDVKSLQLMPEDLERLEKAIGLLAPGELTNRRGWARWAARRAELYKDAKLAARAKQLEGEIVRIEATRPESRSPEAALALARRARDVDVPEPTPSALIHRALSARARVAKTPADLAALAADVEVLLPKSKDPASARLADLNTWAHLYESDPEKTYLDAPEPVRTALDRLLLADVREREIRARAELDPESALDLAAQARMQIPERRDLQSQLVDQGLRARAHRVTDLRRSEVLELARKYDEAGQAAEGRRVISEWLDNQRKRKLGANDASGRVDLALEYLQLLNDRSVAVQLLQEAVAIEPELKSAADLYRRLEFRFDGKSWVDTKSAKTHHEESGLTDPGDPLIGLTQEEILSQRGKPEGRSLSISQGSVQTQWIYTTGRGGTEYFIFQHRPGAAATLTNRYVLP